MSRSRVTGLAELRKSFREIPRAVAAQARAEAHRAAEEIARSIEAGAPVLTGKTRDSIEVIDGPDRPGVASASVAIGGPDRDILSIEFGTLDTTPSMFIRRGFDAVESRVGAQFAAGISAGIRKIADQ